MPGCLGSHSLYRLGNYEVERGGLEGQLAPSSRPWKPFTLVQVGEHMRLKGGLSNELCSPLE